MGGYNTAVTMAEIGLRKQVRK